MMQPFGLVEEPQGETCDVEAVGFRGLASPRQSHDVAAPQIGHFGFGFDSFTMAVDEVVDDAFSNGLVAEDQFVSSDQFHQTAKDHRGRKQGIHAFGIQSGNRQRALIVD